MKINNAAALFIAALITLHSCTCRQSSKTDPSRMLVGKWGFATIPAKKDSLGGNAGLKAADSFTAAILAADTLANSIEFKTDSSFLINTAHSTDSGRYYIDTAGRMLYIKRDSAYTAVKITQLTDSTAEFFLPQDSIPVQLHKK